MHKNESRVCAKSFIHKTYKNDEAPPSDDVDSEILIAFAVFLIVSSSVKNSEYLHKLKISQTPP